MRVIPTSKGYNHRWIFSIHRCHRPFKRKCLNVQKPERGALGDGDGGHAECRPHLRWPLVFNGNHRTVGGLVRLNWTHPTATDQTASVDSGGVRALRRCTHKKKQSVYCRIPHWCDNDHPVVQEGGENDDLENQISPFSMANLTRLSENFSSSSSRLANLSRSLAASNRSSWMPMVG